MARDIYWFCGFLEKRFLLFLLLFFSLRISSHFGILFCLAFQNWILFRCCAFAIIFIQPENYISCGILNVILANFSDLLQHVNTSFVVIWFGSYLFGFALCRRNCQDECFVWNFWDLLSSHQCCLWWAWRSRLQQYSTWMNNGDNCHTVHSNGLTDYIFIHLVTSLAQTVCSGNKWKFIFVEIVFHRKISSRPMKSW